VFGWISIDEATRQPIGKAPPPELGRFVLQDIVWTQYVSSVVDEFDLVPCKET